MVMCSFKLNKQTVNILILCQKHDLKVQMQHWAFGEGEAGQGVLKICLKCPRKRRVSIMPNR